MLAMIDRSLHFVRTKKRLVLEYTLVAIVIATAGLTVALWSQRKVMESRLQLVESVNSLQEITISDQHEKLASLRNQVSMDGAAVNELKKTYLELDKSHIKMKGQLSALEKENEKVRKYLNTPLPPGLGCMLPGTTCRN